MGQWPEDPGEPRVPPHPMRGSSNLLVLSSKPRCAPWLVPHMESHTLACPPPPPPPLPGPYNQSPAPTSLSSPHPAPPSSPSSPMRPEGAREYRHEPSQVLLCSRALCGSQCTWGKRQSSPRGPQGPAGSVPVTSLPWFLHSPHSLLPVLTAAPIHQAFPTPRGSHLHQGGLLEGEGSLGSLGPSALTLITISKVKTPVKT